MKNDPHPELHVLTGAPGSGKTAILDELAAVVPNMGEPAREILAEQRATGGAGTPDRDPSRFVELLLLRSIEKHRAAQQLAGSVLFDRGLPDCVAYSIVLGIDPTPSLRASDVYRYGRRVLLLEPWKEIYVTDDERTMSFAATKGFQEAIKDAYDRTGYTLLEVPRGSVAERAAFVRAAMGAGRI